MHLMHHLALWAPLAAAAVPRWNLNAARRTAAEHRPEVVETGSPELRRRGPNPLLPYDPNTTPHCDFWYDNMGGFGEPTCEELPEWLEISEADFILWNPSLAGGCQNYLEGRSYCISAPNHPVGPGQPTTTTTTQPTQPPSTTTAAAPPGNGVETPENVHPGIVANCAEFHRVESGQNCQVIATMYGISMTNFLSWNTQVGEGCTGLWAGYSVCVRTIGFTAPTTTTTAGNGVETPDNVQPGVVSNCAAFHKVESGQHCLTIADMYGISLDNIVAWNTQVGSTCTGLWAGYSICVGIIGGNPPAPTTTTTGSAPTAVVGANGVTTPLPTQTNMVTNCNKFHPIRETTTCQALLDYNKISLADFYKWNPAVGSDCSRLAVGTNACVAVIGGNPGTTTTAPSPTAVVGANGVTTPLPTQTNMVTNCNKFHPIRETTTCQALLDYNKISLSDFYKWNPAVGSDCSRLAVGTNACVAVIGGGNAPTTTTAPTPTSVVGANGITTPLPTQTRMVTNCNKWHWIRETTTCQALLDYNKITLADFYKWNPAVGAQCTGLQIGTHACVAVVGGGSPPPATTTAKPNPTATVGQNGITTPLPTQTGMVTSCNKFHDIKTTTTCQALLDYNKITLANFYKWNPAVGSTCTKLQSGTHACVGVVGGAGGAPGPTMPGTASNCKKWHDIKTTTTCQGIVDYNKITMDNFRRWNTGVNAACSNLWLGYYVCVGV